MSISTKINNLLHKYFCKKKKREIYKSCDGWFCWDCGRWIK